MTESSAPNDEPSPAPVAHPRASAITDSGPHLAPARYLTADIPGTGGVIKQRPEDFLVEEIPLYLPAGSGEHIYLFIEKRSLSTLEMVSAVARHFDVPTQAVGYAGLKDRAAITRQVVSVHVPGKEIADFPMLQHERLSVLWVDKHANKLRRGHLKGNRFSVRIREIELRHVLDARRVLERLGTMGVPNRFGEQRFGRLVNNHLIGRALILGDYRLASDLLLSPSAAIDERDAEARAHYAAGQFAEAERLFPRWCRTERAVLRRLAQKANHKKAWFPVEEAVQSYFISAFQSAIFNAVLDERVLADALGVLRAGDLAFKHINGAVFAVDDAVLADPGTPDRLARFEVSASGPMWGGSMPRATLATDELERRALEALGVSLDELATLDTRRRRLVDGTRRPLRVPLIDWDIEAGADERGTYIRCAFELPKGSFATVVLDEIMKNQAAARNEDDHDEP